LASFFTERGDYQPQVENEKERINHATRSKFGLKAMARGAYLELVWTFALPSIQSDEHLEEA